MLLRLTINLNLIHVIEGTTKILLKFHLNLLILIIYSINKPMSDELAK